MRELLQMIMSIQENSTMEVSNGTALGAPAPESYNVVPPSAPPSPAPKGYQPSNNLNTNVAWSLAPAAWYVGIGILACTLLAVVSSGFFFLRYRRRSVEAASQPPRPARRPRDSEPPKPPEPFRGVIVLNPDESVELAEVAKEVNAQLALEKPHRQESIRSTAGGSVSGSADAGANTGGDEGSGAGPAPRSPLPPAQSPWARSPQRPGSSSNTGSSSLSQASAQELELRQSVLAGLGV